jgi:hypothetical protein
MQLALDSCDLTPAEVRQRFRWAKRQGNPAWLWPEVSGEAWREALGRIEIAVRGILSGSSNAELPDGDPQAFGLACYTSGAGPLLGWWHERGSLGATAPVAAILDLHLRHNRLRVARMTAAAVALVDALLDRDIAVVVLKGAHTAHAYFPEPGTRPASDIDLLVDGTDAGAAEAVIGSAGYVAAGRGPFESSWRPPSAPMEPRSLRLVHADDPWSVDLHGSLNVLVSAGTPLAELDLAKPMASRRPWQPCRKAAVLEQPLLLLHLAVHAGAGLQNLSLLRLIELQLVIRQDLAAGLFSWDSFLETGQRARSLGFAYPALRLCEDLVPETVPDRVLDRCRRHVPPAVLRVLSGLTPAAAQRVDRSSVAEHFMWAEGWTGRLRQLASDVVPSNSLRKLSAIYEKRAWQLIRGKLSR